MTTSQLRWGWQARYELWSCARPGDQLARDLTPSMRQALALLAPQAPNTSAPRVQTRAVNVHATTIHALNERGLCVWARWGERVARLTPPGVKIAHRLNCDSGPTPACLVGLPPASTRLLERLRDTIVKAAPGVRFWIPAHVSPSRALSRRGLVEFRPRRRRRADPYPKGWSVEVCATPDAIELLFPRGPQ